MNRILSILIVCILLYSSAHAQQRSDMEARKLSMALYAISNLYVDKTDEKKLVEDAIVGMLEKLDPHSDYSDPYVPTEYFFGKKDEATGRDIILQPKVGKTKKTLLDYNVKSGDTLEIISDPIAG